VLIEAYIAIAALAALAIFVVVVWADSFYQAARREQRMRQRQG
jgi:hypothetical protein